MVDEITKNISNKKIISVIDDIENEASILFLLFKAICLFFI
jgi:hypothetical protein